MKQKQKKELKNRKKVFVFNQKIFEVRIFKLKFLN